MSRKKKKFSSSNKKEFYPFYVSDLQKSIQERANKFYSLTYPNYKEKREATTSSLLHFCYGLEFFHEWVKNIEPILLGTTPFSLSKIDEKEFLKNFTKREKPIAKKMLYLIKDSEEQNKKEKEILSQYQTPISMLLNTIWQTIKDCGSIVSFFLFPNKFELLFEALKIHKNINYQKQSKVTK